mmetsp:Transcript_37488/g.54858  ORF Transcript_37488/g.54858 Transcript_37488/m.54858 type:complete len:97 (-) Transcript_37488:201-491(-)
MSLPVSTVIPMVSPQYPSLMPYSKPMASTNFFWPTIKLIFGMDANTYEHGEAGKKQDVLEFASHFVSKGLSSCWGDTPNPENYTTFNARTYLCKLS